MKVMMVWVSWMPAPPEESEPAMVSAIGVVIILLARVSLIPKTVDFPW